MEVDHGTGDANGIAEIVEYLCDDEYEKSQDVIFRACEHILAIDPFKVLPVLKKVRDPPLDSQRILTMLADYNDVRVFFLEHMVSSKVYHANRPEEFRELTTFVTCALLFVPVFVFAYVAVPHEPRREHDM